MITSPGGGLTARPSRPGSDRPSGPRPPAAPVARQAGLPLDLVLQLVLKTLHLSGDLTGTELGAASGCAFRDRAGPDRVARRPARRGVERSMVGRRPTSTASSTPAGPAMLFCSRTITSASPRCRWTHYRLPEGAPPAVPAAPRERVREAPAPRAQRPRSIRSAGRQCRPLLFVYGPPATARRSSRDIRTCSTATSPSARDRGRGPDHPHLRSGCTADRDARSESLIEAGPVEDRRWCAAGGSRHRRRRYR